MRSPEPGTQKPQALGLFFGDSPKAGKGDSKGRSPGIRSSRLIGGFGRLMGSAAKNTTHTLAKHLVHPDPHSRVRNVTFSKAFNF